MQFRRGKSFKKRWKGFALDNENGHASELFERVPCGLILTFGDTARLVEGEDTTIEGGKREGNDK